MEATDPLLFVRTCSCGRDFPVRESERALLERIFGHFVPPKFCQACRARRRQEHHDSRLTSQAMESADA